MTSIPPQGQPLPPAWQPVQYQAVPVSNGLGVTGFITGLLGFLFCWVPGLGLILGILGVVFGGVGIQASRKHSQTNGLAIAGLVLGVLAVLVFVVLIAVGASIG